MLAEIYANAAWVSAVQIFVALLVILICVAAILGKWPEWGWGFPGILIGVLFILLGFIEGWLPEAPSREVSPGVVLCHHLGDHLYYVGRDVSTLYENGDPNNSGYVVRWWKWVNVIKVGNDVYDHRVADCDVVLYQTAEQVALSSNAIVNLPEHPRVVTINAGTDAFWRHDHYGQSQPGFEMLVAPKSGTPRIEKWVFN